jgi:tRNA pseudouridine-54 N-methylase
VAIAIGKLLTKSTNKNVVLSNLSYTGHHVITFVNHIFL